MCAAFFRICRRLSTALRYFTFQDSWLAAVLASVLLVVSSAFTLFAGQQQAPQDENVEAQGLYLVARPELPNPMFAKSVVLMLPLKNSPFLVGLIVNERTPVSLHSLFPDVRSVKKDDSKAYFGGPVDIHDRSAIFQSRKPPKNAFKVFADVYVTFDADTIGALMKKSKQPSSLRIFFGRAQWDPAQLRNEFLKGAWYSLHGNAEPIFSTRPDEVWQTLVDRVAPKSYIDYRARGFPDRKQQTLN